MESSAVTLFAEIEENEGDDEDEEYEAAAENKSTIESGNSSASFSNKNDAVLLFEKDGRPKRSFMHPSALYKHRYPEVTEKFVDVKKKFPNREDVTAVLNDFRVMNEAYLVEYKKWKAGNPDNAKIFEEKQSESARKRRERSRKMREQQQQQASTTTTTTTNAAATATTSSKTMDPEDCRGITTATLEEMCAWTKTVSEDESAEIELKNVLERHWKLGMELKTKIDRYLFEQKKLLETVNSAHEELMEKKRLRVCGGASTTS